MAALFTKKEKTTESQEETKAVEAVAATVQKDTASVALGMGEDIAAVLTHPRITEKATYGTADNIYVFEVSPRATKKQIKEAVFAAYKVHPTKVHVAAITKKKVRNPRTGKMGVKGGGKKAYVYLKAGDKISIM